MRTPTLESVGYSPENPPADPAELQRYLQNELGRISAVIDILGRGHAEKTHVAPPKPREGMMRLADGTNWNPGSDGEGIYAYLSSGWSKLANAERGTWTPVISASGSTFATPTLATGIYTKIDDVCFFELDLNLATSGNSFDVADIGITLPFNAASTNQAIFSRYWSGLVTAVIAMTGNLTASSNSMKVRYISAAGTTPWANIKATDLSTTAGTQLRFSGFYFV